MKKLFICTLLFTSTINTSQILTFSNFWDDAPPALKTELQSNATLQKLDAAIPETDLDCWKNGYKFLDTTANLAEAFKKSPKNTDQTALDAFIASTIKTRSEVVLLMQNLNLQSKSDGIKQEVARFMKIFNHQMYTQPNYSIDPEDYYYGD